jgi:hypothetical protein
MLLKNGVREHQEQGMGGVATRIGSSKENRQKFGTVARQKWPVPCFIPSICNYIYIWPFRSFACQRIGFSPFLVALVSRDRVISYSVPQRSHKSGKKTEASRRFTFSNL